MGNKVLNIGGNSEKTNKKEVYVDVDMTSEPTAYENV